MRWQRIKCLLLVLIAVMTAVNFGMYIYKGTPSSKSGHITVKDVIPPCQPEVGFSCSVTTPNAAAVGAMTKQKSRDTAVATAKSTKSDNVTAAAAPSQKSTVAAVAKANLPTTDDAAINLRTTDDAAINLRTTADKAIATTNSRQPEDVAAVVARTLRKTENVTQYPVYRKRKETAEEVCRGLSGGEVSRAVQHKPTNSAYCVTPKVGCTYWLSVFRWLHNDTWGGRYSSPLDMPRYKVHQPQNLRIMKYFSFKRGNEPTFLDERFKFMFVREPYHRLWSAYVDKFLLPDLWHVDGDKILRHRGHVARESKHTAAGNVKLVAKRSIKAGTTDAKNSTKNRSFAFALSYVRSYATDVKHSSSHTGAEKEMKRDVTQNTTKTKQCSSDVTFTDFLDYITSVDPSKLNEHYRPYHFLCSPCAFRPQLIGKMETFQEDSRNVLQQLNMTWVGRKVKTTESRALHEMSMLINDNFYEIKHSFFRGCINNTELASRLWKAFQINGYLPRNVSLPLRPGQEVTRRQFQNIVFSTYKHSEGTSKEFWRDQKTRAFVEAYREVPDAVLERVTKVYYMDFRLFDYDPYPELLYSYRTIGTKS